MTIKNRIKKIEQRARPSNHKYVILGLNGSKIELPAPKDKTIKVNIDLGKI